MKLKYSSLILPLLFSLACNNASDPISKAEDEQTANSVAILDTFKFEVATKMAYVKGGSYIPLYGRDSQLVTISDFYMDVYPVTQSEYVNFVKANQNWRKSKVKKLFSDNNYLYNWSNDTVAPSEWSDKNVVTNISWYAASKYCACQGKRLPTVDEWEYAAMADQTTPDARTKESFNQFILDWYEKPKTYSNEIGSTYKNYWGIYDLHGIIWEWTSDFNSILLSGESRNDVETDKNLFCGSGSLNSSDLMNYAAFMRYSFRSSVKANYAVKNLGFRCVKDTISIQ